MPAPTTPDAGLQQWLDRAMSHPLLREHEERELGKRVRAGDVSARDRLIEHNLRLVVALAHKHRRWTKRAFADLVQDGMLGLIRAAEKFDPERGCRFSTYATHWVKAFMRGRADVQRVEELCVLDATPGHEGGLSGLFADQHVPDPHDETHAHLRHEALKRAVADSGLPAQQRRAFEIRNGLDGFGPSPKPLSFVATVLGISRERVFQLDVQTRAHLRENAPHLR